MAPAPNGPFPAYLAAPTRKDVLVFVHGLGGDAVKSWTNRTGVYWPRVVANDPELADYDVYVYAYETNPRGECLGIPDLATQMHTRLISDRVFEKHDRVIFVSHSLGGLVVRDMLTTFDELIPKTPLLLFYGTPGHGEELARWASMISRCQQVHDLRPEELNSFLRNLNNVWKHRISDRVRSRCAIEGFNRLVKPASGEALCDDISQTIAGDHSGIVKVGCDRDDPHVFLKNVLSEGQPSRLAVGASGLSVRRITDVGDVYAAAVAADAKTVFVNRFGMPGARGVYVTNVNGATPRKLFDAFSGRIACGKLNCYLAGAINEQLGVYRFNVSEPPVMLFGGMFTGIDLSPVGDRLLLIRTDGQTQNTDIVVRRIDDNSQTIERSSSGWLDYASWHPDGKSMLYVESLKEVVLHDLTTGKQTRLPKATAASISGAAWETRGRYVLVRTMTATAGEFWILRPNGQPIGPMLRDEVRYDDLRSTLLPDIFSAVRSETHTLARLISLDRQEGERQIGRVNIDGPFSWTGPERLLYLAKDDRGSWIEEYDIYAQQVRRMSPAGWIGNAAMTPDGTRLVFSMETDAQPGVWTSPADRWNPVKLAPMPIVGHAISPDSKWVAFAAFGPEGGLYVTTLEPGGEVRRLTRGSIWQVTFAGPRTIIFKRNSDGRRPLCKISRDGGPESCFALDAASVYALSPDWKTVVAVTETDNHARLHFIDIASGAVGKVVTVPGWIDASGGIAWTAGDSRIVYVTQTVSQAGVQAYRIADGANEVVVKPSEGLLRHIAVSPDGRYAVFLRELMSSDAVLLTVTP